MTDDAGRMPAAAPAAAASGGDGLAEVRAEAIAWGRRPRRWGSLYVAEHMVRAMRAYGWTIVVGSLGKPVIYLLGLGIGLAVAIDAAIEHGGLAVDYRVFVGPALLMAAAIAVATEEFTYPVMAGFKWRRFFYGFSASALSPGQIANGVILGATVRMAVTVVAYYLVLLAFGFVPDLGKGWLAVPAAMLAGLAFGAPLVAYAASLVDDKGQFALVQRFVFIPMFLFSGTFYPLDVLPLWLQPVGWISPLWHATELGRVATYGAQTGALVIAVHVAYLVALTAVGYVCARRVFVRRLGA